MKNEIRVEMLGENSKKSANTQQERASKQVKKGLGPVRKEVQDDDHSIEADLEDLMKRKRENGPTQGRGKSEISEDQEQSRQEQKSKTKKTGKPRAPEAMGQFFNNDQQKKDHKGKPI